jgi:Icc-related predicted phosphoesterase
VRDDLRRASQGTPTRFLDNDVADFGGVRFLGTTLWTDYLSPADYTQSALMQNAERSLNDHHVIRAGAGLFTTAIALEEHRQSREWLTTELGKSYDGATVVISHHAPHPLSVHRRYAGNPLNAAFASDLSDLLPRAEIWLHGHVHGSFDYTVNGCRIIANPRGYARNKHQASNARNLSFENPTFQWACVIDVVI